jgi:hypothetical protein
MTPTEELLTEVLAAEAAGISTESLRPLTAQAPDRGRWWLDAPRRTRLRLAVRTGRAGAGGSRPLVALVAAASVLAVIGLVVAARSVLAPGPPFANLGTTASPPPYYVEIDPNDRVIVQSSATGQVTATVGEHWFDANSNVDAAVAASANGKVFVAAFNDWANRRTVLYRFSLTSSGQVTGLSLIPGRHGPGFTSISAALSPDGSEVALSGVVDGNPADGLEATSGPPQLLVVNLDTGLTRTWHGLAGTAGKDLIQDPSWSNDGASLRFLITTCPGGRAWPYNNVCSAGGPGTSGPEQAREWTLPVPPAAGRLPAGRQLVGLPDWTIQAQASPSGGSVSAITLLRSGGLQVARYSALTGHRTQTLLSSNQDASQMGYVWLSADGTGQYLLLNAELGSRFGWIRDGAFHRLPIHGLHGFDEVVAAAW